MKDSNETHIANIETKLEELDKLAVNVSQKTFESALNGIRMKAGRGDLESIRIIDAMTAFYNVQKSGESMEEILQRSIKNPDLQSIIMNYTDAMLKIILVSKSK